jgi:CDGSH-type Zn-finger protein
MPRLVRLEGTGPHKIEAKDIPEGKALWVCQCGLSKTLPFCDGAHKHARTQEPPNTLCVYDDSRTNIIDQRPA